jgi:peptidyl-prolyl cis-trans isomerase C
VNGEPISAEAVARELAQARAGAPAGDDATVRRRVLEDLVDRALLLQDARDRQVVVGQDQVERALLRVRAEYPGTHFDDLLAQERLSQADLKNRLREQLTIERLFEEQVFPGVEVTEAEIAKHHEQHASEYEEPERVRVSQIVLAAREEALSVREQLRRNPGGFAELARKSSIAPEGKRGGDLGYIGRGGGFPEVFDVCFTLPQGTISEVTPSPYGFHVFKVTDRKPAGRRPLADARAEIHAKLLREKRARAQADHLDALRKRATLRIDEKALAQVNP